MPPLRVGWDSNPQPLAHYQVLCQLSYRPGRLTRPTKSLSLLTLRHSTGVQGRLRDRVPQALSAAHSTILRPP